MVVDPVTSTLVKHGPRPREKGTTERMTQEELELDEGMERTRTPDQITVSASKMAQTTTAEVNLP